MYSLKNRITRNLTINMIIVMSGLSVVMYFSMQQLLQDYVLSRLQSDAESLASVVQRDQTRQWRVLPGRMSNVYDRVRSGHYYRVEVNDQVIESRSLFDAEFPPLGEVSGLRGDYLVRGPGEERWLVWFQQIRKDGQAITISIAEDIEPINHQLLLYMGYALVLVVLVTGMLTYLQQRTLYRSFYIFEWLRQNLASIRHRKMDKSALEIPREILPLVGEIEKLVDQLHKRIERTRHAIGNLSHELKRPIQLLSLQLESDDSVDRLKPLEDIKKIVERELRRVKISGTPGRGAEFDLAAEIRLMIELMHKIYAHIQVRFQCTDPLPAIDLDRDDLLELIGNLLDNACKFAATRVKLEIEASQDRLKLVLEDDGQGLDPGQVEQIRTRGVRLDESVAGHGLGLGICTDILDNYHASMSFSVAQLGGLQVDVEIPLSQ